MGGIIIQASCEYRFIRVHKSLVQHPSNYISIDAMYGVLLLMQKYINKRQLLIYECRGG